MKVGIVVVLILATLGCSMADVEEDKSNLRVLYVGAHPERVDVDFFQRVLVEENEETAASVRALLRARTSDFERFLSRHFREVSVAYAHEYKESMSDGYDVTIFGSVLEPDESEGTGDADSHAWMPNRLSSAFDNASILIDLVAPQTVPSESKIDWSCLCLDAHAVGMRLNHPIFNHPNKVDLAVRVAPTPENFKHYYNGRQLPDTLPMWQVQIKGYLTDPTFPIAGMVSSGLGFADAPDAEVIAGGVNSKDVEAVALGRHGNFFLWGFTASPAYMTDEARQVFINTVHYMAQFNGRSAYSRRPEGAVTREIALDAAYQAGRASYAEYVDQQTRGWEEIEKPQKIEILAKQARGERLRVWERQMLEQEGPEIVCEAEWLRTEVLGSIAPPLVNRFGADFDRYLEYYERNVEYLVPLSSDEPEDSSVGKDSFMSGYWFVADEDVASLGLSNRDPSVLDIAIRLLAQPAEKARAMRILTRYTDQSFKTADKWRAWYDEHAERLYFSDLDGYKFRVVPGGSQ